MGVPQLLCGKESSVTVSQIFDDTGPRQLTYYEVPLFYYLLCKNLPETYEKSQLG
ncbi:MAG: hypothetical protein WBB29_15880 [Geitlerinemataceae cyanobacterium]